MAHAFRFLAVFRKAQIRNLHSRTNWVKFAKHAKEITTLKAVRQNLMPAHLSVTDGICGILSGMDVKGEISELSKQIESKKPADLGEINAKLERILLLMGGKTTKTFIQYLNQ